MEKFQILPNRGESRRYGDIKPMSLTNEFIEKLEAEKFSDKDIANLAFNFAILAINQTHKDLKIKRVIVDNFINSLNIKPNDLIEEVQK